MNVCFNSLRVFRCYQRLQPELGGMEQHIAALTREQRELGVEVISVHNSGKSLQPSLRTPEAFDLSSVRSQFIRDILFYFSVFSRLGRYRDHKMNILHVHGDWSAFIVAANLFKRRLDARLLVASVHGELQRLPWMYRAALSPYRLIAATGAGEVKKLTEWTGSDVIHFPSGIADEFFLSKEEGPKCDVVAVGNLVEIRQTEILLRCAAQHPELIFSIYGDGPERKRLEMQKASLGCSNIQFHGKADRKQIAAALKSARVFINVSRSEGTPTAMLEAMAAGLPVIMTPSNDYTWLLKQKQNGILTDGWSLEEIGASIEWCLSDEERRLQVGRENLALAQRHRWAKKARVMTVAMMAAALSGSNAKERLIDG